MRKILIFTILFFSCDKDPISGLERGWMYNDEEEKEEKEVFIITLISPNGGEEWDLGSSHTIRWTSNSQENIKLVLVSPFAGNHVIADNIPNNGSYNWNIASDLTPATDYLLKASFVNDPLSEFLTDSQFSLSQVDNITLISPNGGEEWDLGSSHTISWTSNSQENVHIKLSSSSINILIASNITNDGSHIWVIPNNLIPGTDYRLQISLVSNNNISDYSNSNFSILAVQPSILQIEVLTDTNPSETDWSLESISTSEIILDLNGALGNPEYLYQWEAELYPDNYRFILNDSWGDGIRPAGYCKLYLNGALIYTNSTSWWFQQVYEFEVE
jgi:hypothetical protein